MAGKGGPRARATTTHSDGMHPVTSISLDYGGVPDQSSEPAANPSQPINSGRDLLAEGSEAIYNSAKGKKYVEVDFEPTEEGLKILEDLDLRYLLHPKGIAALRRKFKAPDDKELQNLLAGVSKIIHQTAKDEEERQNRQAPQVGQQHDSLRGLGFPENAIEDEMDWSALHAGDCIYGLITEFMRSENIPLNDPTHVPSRAGPMILKCYRMVIRYFIGDYAHVYLFVTKEGAGPTAVKRYERDVFEMLYPKGAQYELPKGFKQPMFSEAEYEEEGAMIQRIIYRVHKRSLWRKAKTQLTLDTKVRLYYRDRDFPIHHKRVHESLRDRSGKKMSDELFDSLSDLGRPGPGEVIEIVNDRSARLICAGTSSSPNISSGKGANRESDLEEMELDAASLHNTNAGRNGLSICSSRSTIQAAHNHQRNLFEDYREPLNQYRDESTMPGAQD